MNVNKKHSELKSKKEYLDSTKNAKGIQISISLSRNIPTDPYFVNGEHFYKMRMVLGYLEPLLALGMIISFFLPWINITLMYISPYELVKVDNFESKLSFLLLIPSLALFLIFLSKFNNFKTFVSIVLGTSPFLLILFLMDNEKFEKLELEVLVYGFYICMLFSILLIILPLYKMINETTLLNKKKIAFNSKLLKPWLAFGLLGSLSLPWLNFNFFYLNGYTLLLDGTYSEKYWFVVFIPIFSIILLASYRFNMKLKVMSFLTGITPYIVAIFILFKEKLLDVLSFGAYTSMLLGAGLIFLSLQGSITNNKNKQ